MGLSVRDLTREFERPNPDFHKKRRMGFYVGNESRTLSVARVEEDKVLLPRGGWERVLSVLRGAGVTWTVTDRTVSGTGPTGLVYRTPGWELGPDQRSAARQALLRRNGLISGPCASGKSEILLKFIADAGERTLVIVHTERILSDWRRAAAARFNLPEVEVGVLYGREKRERALTIGMVQTLLNLVRRDPAWAARWGTVVQDECHHCPASTFVELLNFFPARYRIGATATLRRRDGKEGLMHDTFGAERVPARGGGSTWGPRVLFRVEDRDLDRYGRIVPVDVVVVPTGFEFDLYREAELRAAGWRRGEEESALASVKRWRRDAGAAGTPLNTYAEMLDAMVDDPQRLARVLAYLLPEVAAGRTCLLLADRRELGLRIQAWLRRRRVAAGRLMGGRDHREQDQTVAGLEDGTLRVAVGTTVGDEGMNVRRLDRGFGLTPTAANPGRLTQQTGRLKRRHPDKADAVYFYLWDRRVRALSGHARAVANAIPAPHRVWFSEQPGEREPLTATLLRELEEGRR